jgi:hypothetical protein
MMRALPILLTVGLLAGDASHAATAEFGPFSIEIAPNSFEERCIKLAAGASMRYRFKSSAPVDFNLHYHRGNDVFYPVKKTAIATRTGRFRAKTADVYCLMWENRSKTVAVIEGVIESVGRAH